jgi:hypothetical protein
MPRLDVDATAHIDSGDTTKPIFLIFLDVDGDPIRACTSGYPVAVPTVDDPDLSGQTFYATAGVLTVGEIRQSESGSDTLSIELSGLLLPDADLLAAIGDRSLWQGRLCRVWVIIRNEARVQQGVIVQFYTGYMSSAGIDPSSGKQRIMLESEGYRALLNAASNRSYLDQKRYDAADTSAGATIGAANGANSGQSQLGTASIGAPGDGGRIQLPGFLE